MKFKSGDIINNYTVIRFSHIKLTPKKKKMNMWLCKCDCGADILIEQRCLNGMRKYCKFCRSRRKNNYKIFDGYVEFYFNNGNGSFIIDVDDLNKVLKYNWYEHTGGYVICSMLKTEKNYKRNRKIYLHRYIMDYNGDLTIDHINHNKKDNRKCNLRVATYSENNRNIPLTKSNTSGIQGVHFNSKHDKWVAQIKIKGMAKYLGRYDYKEDAVRARLIAEKQRDGEFAVQKHLFEKYGIE